DRVLRSDLGAHQHPAERAGRPAVGRRGLLCRTWQSDTRRDYTRETVRRRLVMGEDDYSWLLNLPQFNPDFSNGGGGDTYYDIPMLDAGGGGGGAGAFGVSGSDNANAGNFGDPSTFGGVSSSAVSSILRQLGLTNSSGDPNALGLLSLLLPIL